MSNNNGGTLCLSGGDACMHTYTHKPLKVIIQSPHTSSMYSHHVRLNSFTQTSALEEPNPQHATPCYQQVVRNLLYFFIAPTNWRWTYVISQQCPSSLLNRPDISLIISLGRETLRCEPLWFCPLCHWNLGVELFFLVWIGAAVSLLAPAAAAAKPLQQMRGLLKALWR